MAGDHDDPGGADADPGERYAAAADVRAALDAIPTAGPTLTRSGRPASRS